jgi:hypothetical protein
MVNQADTYPEILPHLGGLDVARFFLYREDIFATALSYYKARVSGVYHSDRTHRRQGKLEMVADEREFATVFDACRTDRQRLLTLHATYDGQLLTYEGMMTRWDATIARIGEVVGLPQLRVNRSLKKLEVGGQIVHIRNEEELRQRFVE